MSAATRFWAANMAILKRVALEELAMWGARTTFFNSRNPRFNLGSFSGWERKRFLRVKYI